MNEVSHFDKCLMIYLRSVIDFFQMKSFYGSVVSNCLEKAIEFIRV